MNAENLIKKVFKRPSVFRDESKLSVDYVPPELPHRDAELQKLANLVKGLVENIRGTSRKVIITGPPGTGKTGVIKRFGFCIQELAAMKGINLRYVHINCRREITPYMVLMHILKSFSVGFPKRGYNEGELLRILSMEFLEKEEIHLILCLDEADHFLLKYPTFLYNLMRLWDDHLNPKLHLILIVIALNPLFLEKLDECSKSTFQATKINFEKYTKVQIADIIRARIQEAFYASTVLDDAVNLIADFGAISGDIRYALELLWLAGKIADEERAVQINAEYVRRAASNLHPTFEKAIINDLSLQQQMALLSVVQQLKVTEKAYVTMGDCQRTYQTICATYGIRPVSSAVLCVLIQSIIDNTEIISSLNTSDQYPKGSTVIRLNLAIKELEPLLIHELEELFKQEAENHFPTNEFKE